MYSLASTTESTEFTVVDPTTGIPTNADSTPTATLRRNESASGVTVTVTNLATGQYRASWTNGAWTAGDRLTLKVSATVSSNTYTETIWEAKIDVTTSSRLAPTTAGRTIDIDANNNAESTVIGWNGVALSTTNPLPNAEPDAAGGLPVSDAGGLDLDAKLANTNEITAARMGALTDWINGGRLDLLLDALLDRLTVTRAGYLDNLNGHTPQTGDTYGALPANFSDLAITASTGKVTVGTNDDKTDYALSASGVTAVQSGLATAAAISALNDVSTADIDARLAAYDAPTKSEMDAAFTEIKGATWSSLTDTLEAIRDRGDSAWITATGFSTLDAAGIRTAVGLSSANLDTQLGSISGVTDKLNTGLESDGLSGYQFTTLALENGPSGSGLDAAGVRTAIGLASANLDSQLSGIVSDIAAIDTGAGTGANTFTIHVEDGDGASLENASVRMILGAENYLVTTDANGDVEVSRDDGTWSVAITLPGYSFTSTTLAVSASLEGSTQTYVMTAETAPESDPGFVTGQTICYDADGNVESGVTVSLQLTKLPSGSTGLVLDSSERSTTSNGSGYAYFTGLLPGAQYQVRRDDTAQQFLVTIPSGVTSPTSLPSFFGVDS